LCFYVIAGKIVISAGKPLADIVLFCCLCDGTEIRSERAPVVPRAAAYYGLRH